MGLILAITEDTHRHTPDPRGMISSFSWFISLNVGIPEPMV